MTTFEQQLRKSRGIRRPMESDHAHAGYERWRAKPGTNARAIPLIENFDALRHDGPGTMVPEREHTRCGTGSVRLDFPTSTAIKKASNRTYDDATMFVPLDAENLYAYNRLTVWVYIDLHGYASKSIAVSLHNEGKHISPVPGRFEGTHNTDIVPGRWSQIVWEFPDIYRDRVTGISVAVSLPGERPDTARQGILYIEDMKLDTVEEPENTRGFALRRDAIAYCHSGYLPGARKQALAQHTASKTFSLLDAEGRAAFTGDIRPLEGGFAQMDFTAFQTPGTYTIAVGDLRSNPFVIGEDAYRSAAWKSLNFFFHERCGFEVPGVHCECHLDAYSRHPDGRTVGIFGGWHDAADLSQAIDKTADVIVAMLDLADATRERDPALHERVLEEARWGLNWAMRTRFGDGYRHTAVVKGIWTLNFRGDKDDIEGKAQNTAIHNYAAAYACAYAAPFYAEEDPTFSAWCLRCAGEDFAFAENAIDASGDGSLQVERLGAAVSTAAMLYRVTREERYLQAAALRARQLASCQQRERRTAFAMPLRGYFYEDRKHTRPVGFFHRSTEQFFMLGYTMLLRDAPAHPDAALWAACVDAYRDYLIETADVMPPYGILPSGVYEVDNTDYSKIYHEGAQVGLPTLAEYNAQVRNGIPLDERHFLRRFPVAYQFRGFHATLLSKAKNAFLLARHYHDRALYDIATRQAEYVFGMNPFAMSTMFGEGYDYPELDSGFAGRPIGAVPVGFETFENDDEPYMPMQNNCTYKEVWVCTTARAMWSIAEIYKGF